MQILPFQEMSSSQDANILGPVRTRTGETLQQVEEDHIPEQLHSSGFIGIKFPDDDDPFAEDPGN